MCCNWKEKKVSWGVLGDDPFAMSHLEREAMHPQAGRTAVAEGREHVGPTYSMGHVHTNVEDASIGKHSPPFRHGDEEHADEASDH
jgi:hypothetical protein